MLNLKENVLVKNIQELWYTIKWSSLGIIVIEEEETQVKSSTGNIIFKIIENNTLNLKKEKIIKLQEAYSIANRLDQKRKSPGT